MREPKKKELDELIALASETEEAEAMFDVLFKRCQRECQVTQRASLTDAREWVVNGVLIGKKLEKSKLGTLEQLQERAALAKAEYRAALAVLRRECKVPVTVSINLYNGKWDPTGTEEKKEEIKE